MRDSTAPTDLGSCSDLESLREHADVPFHERTDRVDNDTFGVVADLDDMAPIGVTNGDGSVLVLRVTESCRWKIPSPSVAPGEEYADVARAWVEEQAGLAVTLDAVEGVWRYTARHEDGNRETTRNFVVFGATPGADVGIPVVDEGGAVDAGWFDELPANAERPPGTDLFFG
ncbi:NUDIX hydrolase [Haloprofundus salinisoli]|uniref:NUDIX hydrolase n=1 Tax=Haloprofundus salinisoli TaxID=2876193 RepID=UPI001CC9FD7A|nr:NUDIX domain-containing protein [Haloprofundus salinisoli]